jgi:hypothetical protein
VIQVLLGHEKLETTAHYSAAVRQRSMADMTFN